MSKQQRKEGGGGGCYCVRRTWSLLPCEELMKRERGCLNGAAAGPRAPLWPYIRARGQFWCVVLLSKWRLASSVTKIRGSRSARAAAYGGGKDGIVQCFPARELREMPTGRRNSAFFSSKFSGLGLGQCQGYGPTRRRMSLSSCLI
jgi:hypothetical protein